MKNYALLVLMSYLFAGCSSLQRSSDSGYLQEESSLYGNNRQFKQEKFSNELNNTRHELGLSSARPMSAGERARVSSRMKLKKYEKGLQTKREQQQYYKFKPYLNSDIERIRFLRLPTVEARQRWIENRGLQDQMTNYSQREIAAIEKKDIVLGMSEKAVIESWGEPNSKEVSGNDLYGNQRWLYLKYVSSNDGYAKENRVIYFEGNRVSGWSRE